MSSKITGSVKEQYCNKFSKIDQAWNAYLNGKIGYDKFIDVALSAQIMNKITKVHERNAPDFVFPWIEERADDCRPYTGTIYSPASPKALASALKRSRSITPTLDENLLGLSIWGAGRATRVGSAKRKRSTPKKRKVIKRTLRSKKKNISTRKRLL